MCSMLDETATELATETADVEITPEEVISTCEEGIVFAELGAAELAGAVDPSLAKVTWKPRFFARGTGPAAAVDKHAASSKIVVIDLVIVVVVRERPDRYVFVTIRRRCI